MTENPLLRRFEVNNDVGKLRHASRRLTRIPWIEKSRTKSEFHSGGISPTRGSPDGQPGWGGGGEGGLQFARETLATYCSCLLNSVIIAREERDRDARNFHSNAVRFQ